MLNKIIRKQKTANFTKWAGIALTCIFIVLIISVNVFHFTIPAPDAVIVILSCLLFAGPVLLIVYFVNYLPFEKSMKAIEKSGKSLDFCLSGLENAEKMPKSKVICAEQALIFERQKWVIPYDSVLWIYKQVVKGAYGLVTVEVNMIIVTAGGEKLKVTKVDDNELLWLLHNYHTRFHREFFFGYGSEQIKKYKEFKKRHQTNE
ncbi:MAG: hypothetical protein E7616_03350 [Ruminococcaceae bacterium]|nr:hypothetical protein [Oscillospiraceae bacterium]